MTALQYEAYVFDFDYTLADATPGIVGCANTALSRLGLPPRDRDAIRRTVGMTLRDTFYALSGVRDERLAERFVEEFKARADIVMTDSTVLFDDTAEVLGGLKKKGRKLAIVTSKFRYRIVEVLHKYGIENLIDHIVGFEDVSEAKPSPEGLLATIRQLAVPRGSVLYIGDSEIDANTAKNASVDFAGVLTGTTPADVFETLPHVMIAASLSELITARE